MPTQNCQQANSNANTDRQTWQLNLNKMVQMSHHSKHGISQCCKINCREIAVTVRFALIIKTILLLNLNAVNTVLHRISMLVVIDHFTYHVPGSQDDGPGPDMATSTTSGGVQSFSTRLKMMHVLHERREKHQR